MRLFDELHHGLARHQVSLPELVAPEQVEQIDRPATAHLKQTFDHGAVQERRAISDFNLTRISEAV